MESRLDRRPAAPSRHHPWRALLAGLLAVLSLGLSIDLHLPGDAHEHEHLLVESGGVYFPEASHPEQPVHVEPATPTERPACAACILRLQTLGAFLDVEGASAPLVRQDSLQLPADSAELPGLAGPCSARAPPQA